MYDYIFLPKVSKIKKDGSIWNLDSFYIKIRVRQFSVIYPNYKDYDLKA